jgi:hypothetical protein
MGEKAVVDDSDCSRASIIRAFDIFYSIIRSSAVYIYIVLIYKLNNSDYSD